VSTLADVLTVFPEACLSVCALCGGPRWRQAGGALVCVICHPDPHRAPPSCRHVPPMPVPERWRQPRTSTARMWRKITWTTVVRRARAVTRELYVAGPWQTCLRCTGHTWVHGDGDDRCARCDPQPGDPPAALEGERGAA
jgi:hypothetical protein